MYLEVVTAVDVTIEEANRRCTEAVSLFTTIAMVELVEVTPPVGMSCDE